MNSAPSPSVHTRTRGRSEEPSKLRAAGRGRARRARRGRRERRRRGRGRGRQHLHLIYPLTCRAHCLCLVRDKGGRLVGALSPGGCGGSPEWRSLPAGGHLFGRLSQQCVFCGGRSRALSPRPLCALVGCRYLSARGFPCWVRLLWVHSSRVPSALGFPPSLFLFLHLGTFWRFRWG